MDFKELLPIGSVVILKNAEKRLMIYGVGQSCEGKDYDYIGVLYPEGSIGEGSHLLFNHSDINEVFFRGFEDAERDALIEKLNEHFNND